MTWTDVKNDGRVLGTRDRDASRIAAAQALANAIAADERDDSNSPGLTVLPVIATRTA